MGAALCGIQRLQASSMKDLPVHPWMRTRYAWDQEGGLDPDTGPVPPDQDGLLLISSSWPGINGSSRKNWENQMDGWRIYLFFGLIKLNFLDELLSFFYWYVVG